MMLAAGDSIPHLGGLGGCPFAQDALVGNIATEKVVEALTARGAALPPLKPLDVLLRATAEIGARYAKFYSSGLKWITKHSS